MLVNGKSIGIIKVKFKAHVNDIPEVLKKAETFRFEKRFTSTVSIPQVAISRNAFGACSLWIWLGICINYKLRCKDLLLINQ